VLIPIFKERDVDIFEIDISQISFEIKYGDKDSTESTGFTEKYLTQGAILSDKYGARIQFQLNKEGTKLFSDITQTAFEANRVILFYLNGHLIGSPTVISEITTDKLAISVKTIDEIKKIIGK